MPNYQKNAVKGKRMDSNFVSKQKWELQYVASKFKVKVEKVLTAIKEVGKARHKVYAYLKSSK